MTTGPLRSVIFDVVGLPQAQGSMRAFIPKGWTRPVLTSANPRLSDWRRVVADTAGQVMIGEVLEGAIHISLAFRLPRPVSLPKFVHVHVKKPDLDKLVRSTLDALTRVIFSSDAQVVSIVATKQYGEPVGVYVTVEEFPARRAPIQRKDVTTPAFWADGVT